MTDPNEPCSVSEATPSAAGRRHGEPSRATVRLRLGPEEGTPREFVPLKLPRALEVSLDELRPDLCHELTAHLELELCAGSHELQLAHDIPVLAVVREGAKCRGSLSVATAPDRPKALVQGATLAFDPPIGLRNVLPILTRLHTLFEDRDVAMLLELVQRAAAAAKVGERLRRAKRWAESWRDWLEPTVPRLPPKPHAVAQSWGELQAALAQLREEPERLVMVEVSRVTARPIRLVDEWILELRFSGEITYLGRVTRGFTDVLVPRPVLPVPHALLDRLLSVDPLVRADVRRERVASDRLLEGLSQLVASFLGSFTSVLELPRLAIATQLADGGRIATLARGPERVAVKGSFAGVASHAELRVKSHDLEVASEGAALALELDATLRACEGRPSAEPELSVGRRWLAWTRELDWPPPDFTIALEARALPGSRLPPLDLELSYEHPLMRGGLELPIHLEAGKLGGQLGVLVQPGSSWPQNRGELDFGASWSIGAGASASDGRSTLEPSVPSATFRGHTRWSEREGLALELRADAEVALTGRTAVAGFPELNIEQGELRSAARGRLELDGRLRTTDLTEPLMDVDFSGSAARLRLDEGRLQLGARSLEIPTGSVLEASVPDAILATSGLGRGSCEVGWDLGGRSPLLIGEGGWVELLVPALRRSRFRVEISPSGGLSVTGEDGGLYDARFFNALLNPGGEPKRWLDILLTDEAIERVLATVRVFSPELASTLGSLRHFALDARDALRAEGIAQPGDFVPGHVMARVASRLLVGTTELADEIYPLVKRVTDGGGLDVPAVKRLLAAHLPEHDYDWELERGLRWLAMALAPGEPVAPRERLRQPPLCEDPRFAAALAAVPSAAELAALAASPAAPSTQQAAMVVRVAPYLSLAQLEHLVTAPQFAWPEPEGARLRYLLELKRRVRLVAQDYGGLSFAPQALAIGFFLGEAARVRAEDEASLRPPAAGSPPAEPAWPNGLLGPEDVAVLLQAGLASAWQNRIVQLNQRLLVELVLAQPPTFLHEVLVEMADGSPRALAGALNALLNPAQHLMREPLDLVTEFSERLGIALPRLDDYLAGGRWAKLSYWQALSQASELVLAEAEPCLAKRDRLRVHRRPAVAPAEPSAELEPLVARAREAVTLADDFARSCEVGNVLTDQPQRAGELYELAFQACAELLAAEPQAFQWDWLAAFWGRNYEALMVRSVVRNLQQDVDDVRRWFAARGGGSDLEPEQALVDRVIDVLYALPDDRARLKADPLVRLLLPPPEGRYDFTIVSAMGVITEGARGRELARAYERLEAEHGVRLVRSDTGTSRSLEHNARRIEEAVRSTSGPWGFIGYSQGCANGLWAESRLRGGTPAQQALASRLVCRQLLFSALNGSAHGSCGDQKFLRLMVEADRFIKHYQALLSRQATRFAIDNLKLALDSASFVRTLGGVASLSYEGVRALARDGQFGAHVPTTIVRGQVEPETLPEALEFLSNVLTRQLQSAAHDTQVEVSEAVGHSVLVDNPYARVLDRCDLGAMLQRTHHWSPIVTEVEMVTTERDRALAVYDGPKDRHVFPWVEVNARFGIIGRLGS